MKTKYNIVLEKLILHLLPFIEQLCQKITKLVSSTLDTEAFLISTVIKISGKNINCSCTTDHSAYVCLCVCVSVCERACKIVMNCNCNGWKHCPMSTAIHRVVLSCVQ